MNSSQLVMVRDNAEVNLSELSVAKLNLSECGLVGGGDSCKLCTTIDYWVEGPVILVVCLAGILGNLASILVLSRKDIDLKPSFANILTCLAVYDLLFEVCAIFMYSLPHLSTTYTSSIFPFLVPYLLGLIHIALMGSIYTTIAVAVERAVTVCAPFTNIQICRGYVYILPIIFLSVVYNIPKFYEVETTTHCELLLDGTVNYFPHYKRTSMRSKADYSIIYIGFSNCVVNVLIPMLLLSLLNLAIYQAVSRAATHHHHITGGTGHRRDSTMAALLTSMVLVFVLCHSLKAGLNIYEAYMKFELQGEVPWTDTLQVLTNISNLLIVINSSVNIVIYAMKDFKFRQVLGYFFCGKPLRTVKHRRSGLTRDGGSMTTMGRSVRMPMASLAFTECGETVEDNVETRALVSGVLITDL